ncbi:MAG TPA: 50S ribosomal protein L10 [Bauldia sp.]|jgi:large subunit ribosomal protein L10
MERAEKSEMVASLNRVFKDHGTVIVAQYTGLTVADMTSLRGRMRAAGGGVKVAKNRLVKLALQGTDAVQIADLFKGPTVIAYSKDPVAAAKVSVDFAKTNEKLVILGGAIGRTNLNPDGVKALASLPSLDELRGKIVGMLVTPATRIAQVVAAPAAQIARVVGAYAKKSDAA